MHRDLSPTLSAAGCEPAAVWQRAPASRDSAADALLDSERLCSVAAAIGIEATAQLIRVFAGELAKRPVAIRWRVAGSDLAGAAAEAHSLAGAALSIGAGPVADAARQVELAAGPGPDVATRLPQALAALSRTAEATLAGLPGGLTGARLSEPP
jgi:HPt (histidine-containing phosphotransfer) domain-containing protein